MKDKQTPDKNAEKIDKILAETMNTISAQDCTGLIPSAVQSNEEEENYEELYPFSPEDELLFY